MAERCFVMMFNRAELLSAYRSTDYVVFKGTQEVVIRIGERSGVVEQLLHRFRSRSAAFITAWNPFSKTLSRIQNNYRQRCLLAHLRRLRRPSLHGEGRGTIGDWPPERSALVFQIDRRRAEAIGRNFRQNAIVFVQCGRPAELILLRSLSYPLECQPMV